MELRHKHLASKCDVGARVMTVATGLAIPVSTALASLCVVVAMVLWLAGGNYQDKFVAIRQNHVVIVALSLFFLYIIGTSYSSASFPGMLEAVVKSTKLLMIAVWASLFKEAVWRRRGLLAFAVGMVLTLILSYLGALGLAMPWRDLPQDGAFKSRITQNFLMALFAYGLAHEAVRNKRIRWPLIALIGLAVMNMVFVVHGRTGYVVLAGLISLFLYRQLKWRGIVWSVVVIAFLGGIGYSLSREFRGRMDAVVAHIRGLENEGGGTSEWYRGEFFKRSVGIIRQHPVFGTGTGSFSREYAQSGGAAEIEGAGNPHSEYLNVTVQLGVLGLGLLIYLFYTQWRRSYELSADFGAYGQGLVVGYGIGCLFNSFLMDFTEGHAFAYFSGLLFAEDRRASKREVE